MRIRDIVNSGRPSVSFEVFPPKRDLPLGPVKAAVAEMAALKPSFMSVTYGAAGGSSSANTAAIAAHVQGCGVTALAHLTCVGATRTAIDAAADGLVAAGVENVLTLRGDLPAGTEGATKGDFPHAADLAQYLKARHPQLCLGGACYPEGHPECGHLDEDIAHLRAKVDAGLDFLTTQMFFDNNVYFHYIARLRDAGITIPVVAGIMPVANGRQIARICSLSGTYLPPRFKAIVDRFGDNPRAMLDAGIAYATEQIIDLFANGVGNVHIYTMNKPEVARRIMANVGGIRG